ncbi:MAG TPA: conjugative transposon protein TraM, partial [Gillisia sp.]|nr:conjugative transposon protein TraM [Gillisia sp.]
QTDTSSVELPIQFEPVHISPKELRLEHQLFYSSAPAFTHNVRATENPEKVFHVEVDGNQVVRAGYRLRMRLTKAAMIYNKFLPANTPVFGFISFKPNRALIEIQNIDHHPVRLKAYDLQDGSEGIYVENSIRADASREVLEDIIQDIDIPGVPQVSGVKQVFQRNNRNVKVTVTNNYKLILKAAQGN